MLFKNQLHLSIQEIKGLIEVDISDRSFWHAKKTNLTIFAFRESIGLSKMCKDNKVFLQQKYFVKKQIQIKYLSIKMKQPLLLLK